jgi:hypothetical protein
MNSRPYYQRAVLPLLMIMVATMACFCTWTPSEACWDVYGEDGMSNDDPKLVECRTHVTNTCGTYTGWGTDVYAISAHRDCLYNAALSLQQQQALSAGGGSCGPFRLTSPLDGMANGSNTFYWDPYPGATGYRIQILESGVVRGTFDANSSQTNLVVDMGIGSVGEGSMFQIRLQAFVGPNIACTNDYYLLRGAPQGLPPGNSSNIIMPPIISTPVPPVCNNNFFCEAGEDPFNCPKDCAPK